MISGLLRTTIREKLTFRDVAAMQQIADWLKTLGMFEAESLKQASQQGQARAAFVTAGDVAV